MAACQLLLARHEPPQTFPPSIQASDKPRFGLDALSPWLQLEATDSGRVRRRIMAYYASAGREFPELYVIISR